MFYITDKQTDEIIDFIPASNLIEATHTQSITNFAETLEASSIADGTFVEHLGERNRILTKTEDGEFREFRIESAYQYHGDYEVPIVEIEAVGSYADLMTAKHIPKQVTSAWTAKQHAESAVNGTEWRIRTVAGTNIRTLRFEKPTNPFAYLKRIASEFELEIKFAIEIDGNRIVDRYIDLVERVGTYHGKRVEFGKDLTGVEREENDGEIVTALFGYAPEDSEGNQLSVFVEDKDALTRWGRDGQHIVDYYEVNSDNQEMTEAELTQYTRTELNKRINASVKYTIDFTNLEEVPGLDHEAIRLGDTILIKDEAFTPALYLEARVFSVEVNPINKREKVVEIGDFVRFTGEQVDSIWRQLQREIQSKISLSELQDVTYTKPEIDGKDNAVREDASQDAQAKSVEAYLNTVNAEKEAVDKRYLPVYESPYLTGVAKTELQDAKVDYNTKYNDLITEINDAIADGETTEAEKSAVDAAFLAYRNSMGVFFDKFEIAYDFITQAKASEAEDNANSHTDQIKQQLDAELLEKAGLEYVNDELALKADSEIVQQIEGTVGDLQTTTDDLLIDVANNADALQSQGGRITTVEADLDTVEGQLSVAIDDLSTLEGTVSQQGTQISANTEAISLKASQTVVEGLQEEFNNLTIGGRNYFVVKDAKEDTNFAWSNGSEVTNTGSLASGFIPVEVGEMYICNNVINQLFFYDANNAYIGVYREGEIVGGGSTGSGSITKFVVPESPNEQVVTFMRIAFRNNFLDGRTKEEVKVKIEKGNKVTDWTPAPEDVEADINEVGTKVTDINAELTTMAGQIEAKAEKSVVETLEGDVTSLNTQVGNLQVSYDGISAEVSDLEAIVDGHTVTITDHTSSINVLSNEISSKVSSTYVENAIADINIGGRNLFLNSREFVDNRSSYEIIGGQRYGYYGYAWNFTFNVDLVEGETYTVSVPVYNSSETEISRARIIRGHLGNYIETIQPKEIKIITNTFTATETEDNALFRLLTHDSSYPTLAWAYPNLVKGNKATDWSPAPEDVQSNIDSVYSYAESEITQLAGEIQSKVSSTEFDGLSDRVTSAESVITQHSNEIATKVEEDGVISAINQSPETIKIQASNIQLQGAVTVLSDIANNLGTITAGEITGTTITGSTFISTDSDSSIEMSAGYFRSETEYGDYISSVVVASGRIVSNSENISTGEVYVGNFEPENFYIRREDGPSQTDLNQRVAIDVDKIEFERGFGGFDGQTPGIGYGVATFLEEYFAISSHKQELVIQAVNNPIWLHTEKVKLGNLIDESYIEVDYDYDFHNGTQRVIRIVGENSTLIPNLTVENGYFEIGSYSQSAYGKGLMQSYYNADEQEWKLLARTGSYGSVVPLTVSATNFSNTSTSDIKEDISTWDEDVLDKYRSELQLYRYHLIGDKSDKYNHGIVIGEGFKTFSDVVSSTGNGVNNYEFISHNAKAIQELIGVTDDHADELNFLKMELQYLRGKITQLEGGEV